MMKMKRVVNRVVDVEKITTSDSLSNIRHLLSLTDSARRRKVLEGMIGKKHGRWTVVKYIGPREGVVVPPANSKNVDYECKCECGTVKNISYYVLKSKRHFECWRCFKNQKATKFKMQTKFVYGQVFEDLCDTWLLDYDQFVKDMGLKPEGYKLVRLNSHKPYSKSNCKWEKI
jgi:hypothetical protein